MIHPLVEHLMKKPERVQTFRNQHLSYSEIVFWNEIVPHLPVFPEHDRRCLNDFPLVILKESFVHNKTLPIIDYNLLSALNLFEGVDWHVFSDRFFTHRTHEWFYQCKELFELCLLRLCDLGTREYSANILNMEGYYIETLVPGTDTKTRRVNEAFYYDVEAFTSNFLRTSFEQRFWPERGPKLNYKLLFEHIRQNSMRVSAGYIVRSRTTWYNDILINEAHRRIHKRRQPFNVEPSSRQILVAKHPSLYKDDCTSQEDVLNPKLNGDPRGEIIFRISMDAMFVRECRTFKSNGGDPIAALLKEGYPRIKFHSISGLWSVHLAQEDVHGIGYESLLEAFVFFRMFYPGKKKKGPTRLDAFDKFMQYSHN